MFIELTHVDGDKMFVNLANVIHAIANGDGCLLITTHDRMGALRVQESYDTVVSMIACAQLETTN